MKSIKQSFFVGIIAGFFSMASGSALNGSLTETGIALRHNNEQRTKLIKAAFAKQQTTTNFSSARLERLKATGDPLFDNWTSTPENDLCVTLNNLSDIEYYNLILAAQNVYTAHQSYVSIVRIKCELTKQ